MRTTLPRDAIVIPENATRVFEGIIHDVYQWPQEQFDGSTVTFEMTKRPDTVQVFLVKENKILIQKQEQPFVGAFYSLPGGRHEVASETEVEAMARELKEETGIVAAELTLVAVEQPHSKTEFFVYTFVADGVKTEGEMALNAGEKIENIWMSVTDIRKVMDDGAFRGVHSHFFDEIDDADTLLEFPEYVVDAS